MSVRPVDGQCPASIDLSATHPSLAEGEPILFRERFRAASGRARFVPADYTHAAELPDAEFPFIFVTGRQLEHWHTGSMNCPPNSQQVLF